MKKASTIFLRIAIVAFGALVLLFSIFLLPHVISEATRWYALPIVIVAAIGIYGAAIPFYVALYQGVRLLGYIDKNTAFSARSVRALGIIKFAAIATGVLFTGSLPLFYAVTQDEDAPGLMLIAIALTGAPLVIGVFAAVMQRLLQNVVAIKSENDLTV